ncbi:MAG TPA: aromatic ring-hydroxylating dioxygenase subunit alpha [Acetobacteraceae bacterium]|nr:aromatic ring-hydroxylating dioxygenase subunit alpha [Acetobacteraceae bacterium]
MAHQPVVRMLNELRELQRQAYTSEEFARREAQTVFHRNWVHVAGGYDLPEPGDAHPVVVAGLPIVLVRQRNGEVAGFHNVCRHRGCLLVTEPQQRRPLLTCKFHAWAYDLDGRLRRTPYWDPDDGTADPGFDPARFGLLPVATAVWCDQVFVRLSTEGPSFEEHITPLARRWRAYDLSLLRYGFHVPYEVAANWKLVVQNFLDTYHLPFLHPQLGTVAQAKNYDDVNEGDTAIGISYRAGGVEKDKGDLDMPSFPDLPARERAAQDILLLYPNTLLELVAGHLLFIRIDPAGAALTREVMSGYFVGDGATDPRWQAARERLAASWDELQRQDFGVVTAWHQAQFSPAASDQPEVSPLWERSGAWFRARVAREVEGHN